MYSLSIHCLALIITRGTTNRQKTHFLYAVSSLISKVYFPYLAASYMLSTIQHKKGKTNGFLCHAVIKLSWVTVASLCSTDLCVFLILSLNFFFLVLPLQWKSLCSKRGQNAGEKHCCHPLGP